MGGVPGAAAARLCPMVGFGAKKLSDALTASRVAQLRATIAAGGKAPMTYSPAPGNIGSDERYRARRSSPSTLAPRQHRLRINTETQGRLLVHLRPRLLLGLLWGSRLWRLSTLRFAHWAVACRTHGTSGGGWNPPLGIHVDWHVGSKSSRLQEVAVRHLKLRLKRRDASGIVRSVIIDHPSSPAVFDASNRLPRQHRM